MKTIAVNGERIVPPIIAAILIIAHNPKLPIHWMWWPAIGGLFVGIGGYLDPRVLGVGYDTIHSLLRGELIGGLVIGLLVGKALVWAISLGSGTSGGVLAPLLIMGGALGVMRLGGSPSVTLANRYR